MSEVHTVVGDLLDQPVEIIVNAWNRNFIPWWLLLPQGVSGAIKRRGGYAPFRELGKCGILEAGEARLTSAGKLRFRGIIHVAALNLLWRSSPEILKASVTNALALASEHAYSSIALPLIGAGTGGVPAEVAKAVILEAAEQASYSGSVVIVVFGRGA